MFLLRNFWRVRYRIVLRMRAYLLCVPHMATFSVTLLSLLVAFLAAEAVVIDLNSDNFDEVS